MDHTGKSAGDYSVLRVSGLPAKREMMQTRGVAKFSKKKRHSCMQMVLFLIEAQRQAFLYLKERRIQKKETANQQPENTHD